MTNGYPCHGSIRAPGKEERDRFTDRLETSLVDAYARGLRPLVVRN